MSPSRSLAAKQVGHLLAIGLIILSVFLMALQDWLFKFLSGHTSLWQIYVLRSLVALALLIIWTSINSQPWFQIRSISGWVYVRSLLLISMFIALYAAVPFIDMATIAAGFYVSPMITTLLSAVVIKEAVNKRQGLGMLIGFWGILIILKPGTSQFQLVMLLPILAAFFYSLAAIITRSNLRQTSAQTLSLAINLGLLMTGIVFSVLIVGFDFSTQVQQHAPFLLRTWQHLDLNDWAIIILLGILAAIIGATLAKAYQIGPATVIAGFDYSYMIFAVFWGYVFFEEIPALSTLSGMVLIALAGYLVASQNNA